MKTLIATTTAALVLATGAFAESHGAKDEIERALLKSGQTELAAQYPTMTQAQKQRLTNNKDARVRAAASSYIQSLYD